MRDEHSHILWGVDDGCGSLSESLVMLDEAQSCGVDCIYCTPHLKLKTFDADLVHERFEELKPYANGRDIVLTLGYEVYYNRLLELGLDKAPQYRIGDTNEILVEFKNGGEIPFGWEHSIYVLQTEYDLKVTIAHPERYATVWNDFDAVYRLKEAGCRLQISTGDLQHRKFEKVRRISERMIREGLCDVLVSDAHRKGRYIEHGKVLKRVSKYR